jgi:hypothetical protein
MSWALPGIELSISELWRHPPPAVRNCIAVQFYREKNFVTIVIRPADRCMARLRSFDAAVRRSVNAESGSRQLSVRHGLDRADLEAASCQCWCNRRYSPMCRGDHIRAPTPRDLPCVLQQTALLGKANPPRTIASSARDPLCLTVEQLAGPKASDRKPVAPFDVRHSSL